MLERTSAQSAALAAELRNLTRCVRDDAAASVEVFVRENPWTTVSAAAALGLMIGAWMASPGKPGER